jgi:hypothetical protein
MGNKVELLVRDISSPPAESSQRFIDILRHEAKFRHNITTGMKKFTIDGDFYLREPT